MSPAQKVELMSLINEFVVSCIRKNIGRDHPGWSQDQVTLELIRTLHGDDIDMDGFERWFMQRRREGEAPAEPR